MDERALCNNKDKKMEAIKIIRYLSPVGEMMIGSYGGYLCICDWAKEKRRGTIDRRICQHLNAEYEEGTSEVIEQAVSQLREYFQGGNAETLIYPLYLPDRNFKTQSGMN